MKLPSPPNSLNRTLLAVPAAALMLGAAEADSTVGLNFQAWYFDSGTTPQTVGYGHGYLTTGFPVTAKAFGVEKADWTNTEPLYAYAAVSSTVVMGSITAKLNATNPWTTGIGNLSADEDPAVVVPGDDEVTWGMLDNTGWNVKL